MIRIRGGLVMNNNSKIQSFSFVFAVLFLLIMVATVYALEPIDGERADVPNSASLPGPVNLIVKYRDDFDLVRAGDTAVREQVSILSEQARAPINHIRTMSGNAQVVALAEIPSNAMAEPDMADRVAAIIDRISELEVVEYVEIDGQLHIQQQAASLWHYGDPPGGIGVVDAWPQLDGDGVVVAVIDTGVLRHGALQANLLPGYDFISSTFVANDGDGRDPDATDPGDWVTPQDGCGLPSDSSWHGTHVSGTVAGNHASSGFSGVAPQARIVPVRVLGKCGGSFSDIADGVRWAAGLDVPGVPQNANPARILNLSLGSREPSPCSSTIQSAFNDVIAEGAFVVVAAGNKAKNAANYAIANCNGVFVVSATTITGSRAYYSNFGNPVHVSAPGGETPALVSRGVLSSSNSGTTTPANDIFEHYQGTSMAAPHVAGTAALIWGAAPTLQANEVSSLIIHTARAFPNVPNNQCTTDDCGSGIVDVERVAACLTSSGNTNVAAYHTVLGDGPGVHSNPALVGNFTGAIHDDIAFVGQGWSGSGLNVRIKESDGVGGWTARHSVLGDGAGVHAYPALVGNFSGEKYDDIIFVGQGWSGSGLQAQI